MDILTTPGNVRDTALRLGPTDGTVLMTVDGPGAGGHSSVTLRPDWLLPLAAWFAGEAQPAALGDRPGTLYGVSLDVRGDGAAVAWNTHTWARLDCRLPYGPARVTVGPRGRAQGSVVMLSPEARRNVATWLRRAGADGRARRELTA
ncbi:hypothetical protein ACW7N6_38410 [Streptomyces sp. UC1A3]